MNLSHLDSQCPICRSRRIHLWGSAPDIGNPAVSHKIARCHACTHIFVNPLPSSEFLAEAYRTNNPSVLSNDGFFDSRARGPFSEGDRLVLQHVKSFAVPGNLLDIGAANPRLLMTIKESGWRIFIVEPSPNVVQMEIATNARIFRGVFEDCVFHHHFEVISAIDVLEHVSSPVQFLNKIKSVLSIGGEGLLRFPNSYSLKCRFEQDRWNMIRPLGHLHYFSPRSFKAACNICNLRIKALRSHDLDSYGSLAVIGRIFRSLRFLSPLRIILDRLLLGDQLLATISQC